MDGGLKQRLVGALVLLALAIIFVPVLLDNQRDDAPLTSRIPPEPKADEIREIPLNLEDAHRKVVEEQQALVAHSVPTETGAGTASNSPPALPASDNPSSPAAGPASVPASSESATVGSVTPLTPVTSPATDHREAAARHDVPTEPATHGTTAPSQAISAGKPAATVAASKPAKSGQDAIGAFLQSAWVVQAGVFSNEANARTLVTKLKAAGFKAFVRKDPKGARVFIGPELDRAKAQAMLPKVQEITHVKPMLAVFDPLAH